jgi:hypothetical protein
MGMVPDMANPFDWGTLFGVLGVIGIPLGLAVGIAMSANALGEFRWSRICFILTAVLALATFLWLERIRLNPDCIQRRRSSWRIPRARRDQ